MYVHICFYNCVLGGNFLPLAPIINLSNNTIVGMQVCVCMYVCMYVCLHGLYVGRYVCR